MQKNCVLIVFSLLVVSCYCQEFSFEGLWTDDVVDGGFGGNFSICIDGTNAWGLYSEFGLAIGSISEDGLTFSGTFYEGGQAPCLVGPFSLSIVDNGTRFEGKYGCREQLLYTWNARRINFEVQSDHDCAKVIPFTNTNNIVDGKWWKETNGKSSQVDFCTNNDYEYQTSYSNPTFTPEGYDEGIWFKSRKIATGTFYRANNNGALPGTSIWFINTDGNLVNIWWVGLTENLNIRQINDTDIHGYDVFEYTHGTTQGNCARYSALSGQNFDYYPYAEEVIYFSPYERVYPDFTISQTSQLEVNSTVDITTGLSTVSTALSTGLGTSLSTVYGGSSDASAITYSFAILLITLLFC